jgi:hypothetical protein
MGVERVGDLEAKSLVLHVGVNLGIDSSRLAITCSQLESAATYST